MGISLWIVPSATDAQRLQNVMDTGQLRTKSVQETSYPKFHPHITVATLPLSVENKLTDIEASVTTSKAPLTVKLSSVEIGSHYFRSVYIAIEPTSEIMDLHGRIHEALHAVPRTPSFPHLSLCYIDDKDATVGEREAFYKTLMDRGKIRAGGEGGVSLDCGLAGEDWMDGFEANEIWVVRCEGPVNEWAILKKLPI
ncbi:LigT-like protein [Phlegmacium glaucopus]|nr:LigT-like protein [Phlegmacium glaucopus]